ncbi:MAG: bifunctional oligoribonuclease/PAP phosphatase NrnA [Leptospirales bacterium]|nr:bifunctional oligoribonuclease/PAP phosphatase NrnA [Leptospirales bacterium]
MENGFQNLDAYLRKHDKFIVSTHESPDADGLGAEIAFAELLVFLGKEVIILNSDPTPGTIEFVDVDREIIIFDENTPPIENSNEYAQFVLDTNDFDNIGVIYHTLKDSIKDIFIIDHHEGDADKLTDNFIRASASSACEIIYDIIQHYKMPLTFKSAQAIYTGIVFDTGSFRYPKTSPHTYEIAAHCVKTGVIPHVVYENLYERNSLSSFALRSKIASSMEILENGKLIVQSLTPQMLNDTGAAFAEGESSINTPLTVSGVVASLLVKQDHTGPVKISMRTKGDYNVADIALQNGGGGHKNAAGFKSKLSFGKAYDHATDVLQQLIKNKI